jgi:hypothetical protein
MSRCTSPTTCASISAPQSCRRTCTTAGAASAGARHAGGRSSPARSARLLSGSVGGRDVAGGQSTGGRRLPVARRISGWLLRHQPTLSRDVHCSPARRSYVLHWHAVRLRRVRPGLHPTPRRDSCFATALDDTALGGKAGLEQAGAGQGIAFAPGSNVVVDRHLDGTPHSCSIKPGSAARHRFGRGARGRDPRVRGDSLCTEPAASCARHWRFERVVVSWSRLERAVKRFRRSH